MSLPILYSFRRCPFAIRARLALHASGTEVEHREILLRDKPEEMLAASPKGTVPVLVLAQGKVIDESIEVMRWALGRNDPESWLEGDDPALIERIDGPFKHHLDRYKYASRHDSDEIAHRTAALEILAELEARLEKQPYLCGPRWTMADAAVMPFVRQFAMHDRAWFDAQPLPRLRAWLDAALASPRFAEVMVKHPLWQAEG
ncbi:glutathione S-transferase [Sphingomicrobium lutaoense]|uniref:Glutathione S-transferase n=1 Tax=Sphingomicrobium lutaoense TaxID=515949 RepID=A0A839Z103_9SPHN|nr:glutathione S-transferase [Sphingomicrobium lutaoense]MBB3764936.1 glutathione S-transferase [Sphingomicrobium lutaoense]